ncbi:SCO3242 family prenyltransferase [Goodfellowiella coeruleoviolacea]|uniref:SCO3242 family prenyltransferase n=1 Tax=Goodfellowiella coeruleoviolacea TaxID=334858 RepID=UPI0020A3D307|nr:UbiA family prenyltransferase [Goodfellowiella coeruleoviolacea]
MRALAQLVRAPAALTVLGDTVAGAAAAGRPLRGRRLALPLASVALYWSGMALNDWADRAVDAVERPERPIPSGRISANGALAVAVALTATGLGLAAVGGGRDALGVAVPLAGAVWAYDTLLKPSAAGPVGMATCRALDVLLGAGLRAGPRALAPAAVIAGHTLGVTALSRGEVHGARPSTALGALTGTAAATLAAVTGVARSRWHRAAAAAGAAVYAATVGRAQLDAARRPDGPTARAATGAGIHGMVPLQAALAARRGSITGALAVVTALPLARRLSRKVSPT